MMVGDTDMFFEPNMRYPSKYERVFRIRYTLSIEIRTCFSNGEYVSVRNTDVFSPPAGGVRGAYAIRPYTRYMPYIKIRIRFPNGEYVSIRDTAVFSKPGTRHPSKYKCVFQTGYT